MLPLQRQERMVFHFMFQSLKQTKWKHCFISTVSTCWRAIVSQLTDHCRIQEDKSINKDSLSIQLGHINLYLSYCCCCLFIVKQITLSSESHSFISTCVFIHFRCRNKYYNLKKLTDTSVIIVFHNEAWSTLGEIKLRIYLFNLIHYVFITFL